MVGERTTASVSALGGRRPERHLGASRMPAARSERASFAAATLAGSEAKLLPPELL